MGHRIELQADRNFRVWSTITDSYIITDATEAELTEYYIARAAESERLSTAEACSRARKKGPVPKEKEG